MFDHKILLPKVRVEVVACPCVEVMSSDMIRALTPPRTLKQDGDRIWKDLMEKSWRSISPSVAQAFVNNGCCVRPGLVRTFVSGCVLCLNSHCRLQDTEAGQYCMACETFSVSTTHVGLPAKCGGLLWKLWRQCLHVIFSSRTIPFAGFIVDSFCTDC
jgi:hypothetical protein